MNKILYAAVFLTLSQSYFGQKTKSNETVKDIETVVINKTKKAIDQKADRTIFDFSEQAHLNSGTSMEGIKKIPGMVVTDIAGLMYQGKPLQVYMDGRPMNISTNDLTGFLEGMPASAIDRIEVITQPGAEFPATSGGAILNIITSKTAKNYLSATYSGGYRFSNYEKFRNKFNNSISLNSRNKWMGWQFTTGQTYAESFSSNVMDELANNFSDKYSRSYFIKAATTFDFGKDRLLLNYDFYTNNNDASIDSKGISMVQELPSSTFPITYENIGQSKTKGNRNEYTATYQKRFSDKNQKLDFRANYSHYTSKFNQQGNQTFHLQTGDVFFGLDNKNGSDQKFYNFKVDYAQPIKILDEGKISFGGLYEKLDFTTDVSGVRNLDYQRQTASTYAELSTKVKKYSFIVGLRAENYDISGESRNLYDNKWTNLTPFNKFQLFPNASIQYDFAKSLYFNINYNRKITLPSTGQLNPNNNTLQNPNISITGNPNIQPTIYNNFEAKLSAFDYAYISYNVSHVQDQVMMYVTRNKYTISQTNVNIDQLTSHNFSVGLPVPFMVFKKPISEVMKFNFNPDKINFVYLYAGYQFQDIKQITNPKGIWYFNVMGQFILPKGIKFTPTWSYSTKGNYYFFQAINPIMNRFDLNFSKKFYDDRLNVSLFANDIFNSSRMNFATVNTTQSIMLINRWDSRTFGISVNYKIPTKNKLAKEDANLLNNSKPVEESGMISPK